MEVEYRQLFLKDLKKLKKQPIYERIVELSLETLPLAVNLEVLTKMSGEVPTYKFSKNTHILGGDESRPINKLA